jgi:hypothetical protein
MNKRFLSQMAFGLICMGSFTAHMPAMEPIFQKEQIGQCVGTCNRWTSSLKKLNCGHSFCDACSNAFKWEKQQQLDHTIYCFVCDAVVWQGHQLDDPTGDPISNKSLIWPALNSCLHLDFKLFLGLGSCGGISMILDALGNRYQLSPSTKLFLAGLSSVGISAVFTQHKLKNISAAYENIKNINSNILQQRLYAFKTNYCKKNLIYGIAMPIALTGLLYATAKYTKTVDSEQFIDLMPFFSFLGNWAVDIWGSEYKSIPKLK